MTTDAPTVALIALLASLSVGVAARISWPVWIRLRAAQAARRDRIAEIEEAYRRDMSGDRPYRN